MVVKTKEKRWGEIGKKEVLKELADRQEARIRSRERISSEQKRLFLEALGYDCSIKEALRMARIEQGRYEEELMVDDDFMIEVEWWKQKTKLIAKRKVLEGIECDKTGKFSLDYLKSRFPEEYGKGVVENKNTNAEVQVKIDAERIKAIEGKELDEMLKQYYTQDNL